MTTRTGIPVLRGWAKTELGNLTGLRVLRLHGTRRTAAPVERQQELVLSANNLSGAYRSWQALPSCGSWVWTETEGPHTGRAAELAALQLSLSANDLTGAETWATSPI